MDWITNGKSFIFDLTNDEKLLNLVGELGGEKLNALVEELKTKISVLGDAYNEVRNVSTPFELLQLFATDSNFSTNVQTIAGALESLGIDSSGLLDLVEKVQSWIEAIPEEYKKLLRPVGDFFEETSGADPGLVKWQLLEAEESADRTVGNGVAIKLSGAGKASLQLEAGHKSTFSDEVRYTRIGLAAEVDAKASASVPLNLGSVSFGAGVDGSLQLNYLNASDDRSEIYAKAVGSSISSLANPMDFNSIWSKMMDDDLRAVRVKAAGAAYGSTSVGLAKKADIPGIAEVSAGLTFDAEIRYGGAYRYDVRRIDDSLIELTLTRTRDTSRTSGLGVMVIINAKQLAEKIKGEIKDDLGELNKRYKQLDKYLEPGIVIRTEIAEKIQELTNDETAIQLLKLAFGLTDKMAVNEKLADVVEGAISTRSAVWRTRAEDGAASILAELIDRYPILNEAKIQEKLAEQLPALLGKLADKLETEVKDLVAAGADDVLDVLESSDVKVNRALNKADEALAGVRRALTEYHTKIEKILKGLEKYATSEIKIELQTQSTTTSGTGVSLTAQFTSNSPVTQNAYSALLSGDLDEILNLNSNQPDGVTIDLEEWQRFADFKRKSGWNLSILDISLGSETMFSTKSRISIDDDGVIGVLSEGEWTRRRSAYKESWEFGFVDAYRLLVTKQTRSLSANIKLSQEDENTRTDELSGFLSRLEEYGLVETGIGSTAEDLLEQWEGDAGNSDIKTKITAKLRLTDADVESLIGIEKEASELKDEYFVELVCTHLKKVGEVTQEEITLADEALRKLPGVSSKEAKELSSMELIAKYTPGNCRKFIKVNWPVGNVRDALKVMERIHDKAIALRDMVSALREIWLADPQNTEIDEVYYRKQQEVIDDSLRKWVKIGKTCLFWLSKKAHPSTVTLLLCITFLADIRGRSPMIVTISRDDGEDMILP